MLLALIDGVMTLLGQSTAYWSNYLAVNEASPLFAGMLQLHPLAFVLAALVWMLLIGILVVALPRCLALILSIAITFGHTIGSGNWLFEHFELGYQLANAYYLLSACALGIGIQYAMGRSAADEVLRISEQARWKLGGGALVVGTLLLLVPW